jgi:phosphoenolpyruvate-protein phosphotransferase
VITLTGIPLAPGVATGKALTIHAGRIRGPRTGAPGTVRERLAEARGHAQLELTAGLEAVPEGAARQILRAHLALLDDPVLVAGIEAAVETGLCAEDALDRAASVLTARFAALRDPGLRARAADLSDVCECVARHLTGGSRRNDAAGTSVVCAAELSAAQVLQLIDQPPLAFVLETTVDTSHAAILIRSLGVPAVIGLTGLTAVVGDGDLLVVDGADGRVVVNPDPAALNALESDPFDSVRSLRPGGVPAASDAEPARTLDSIAVAITATVIDAADARRAIAAGADGIGLFRTEWLFLRTDALPSEERQYQAYRDVATLAGDRPVTMRTIDLGSDKRSPALPLLREPNPALGLRGVRLALAYPDLMKTQFRALFRAFEGRRLRVLLPMVNDVDDVARMRELSDQAGGGRGTFEMGVLIETPAAALMADELAAAVDFLSLGTNDLTQYVLAADRENPSTAALYQPLHPAVLRILRHVMTAAGRYGRPVAVCGEAASDAITARVLVGLGVTELSVPAAAVARSKQLIRGMSVETMRALAEELMALPTAAAVAARLEGMRRAEA